jgi:hypothetical protein
MKVAVSSDYLRKHNKEGEFDEIIEYAELAERILEEVENSNDDDLITDLYNTINQDFIVAQDIHYWCSTLSTNNETVNQYLKMVDLLQPNKI